MIQKTTLHFSEEQFDGFYQLSIFIDEEGLRLECEVPEHLKAAFEKRQAVEDYMDLVTNRSQTQSFSIWGTGAIRWDNLQYLLYTETEQGAQDYSFSIDLVDKNNEKARIKGFSPNKNASSLLSAASNVDFSEIIDAPQDPQNNSFLEHEYLKKAFQQIIDVLEPLVVDTLIEDYTQALEKGNKIKFGLVEIDQNGMYLKQPGWLFSKKVLVEWSQIKIGRDANAYHFSDASNAKRKIVVAKSKLENIGLLLKLIQWGKNR